MTYYIFLAIGFLLMWAKTLDSAMRRPDFSIRFFITDNWFKFAFGAAGAAACAYGIDYFFQFADPRLGALIALMTGFSATSFVNEFLKIFRSRVKF